MDTQVPLTTALTLVLLAAPMTLGSVAAAPDAATVAEPALLDGASSEHGDTLSVDPCGGVAPLQTFCDNGSHTDGGTIIQQCLGQGAYTGTIESRVTYSNGNVVSLRCHYENGQLLDSETEGDYPWFSGVPFMHRCWSLDLHTETQGGSGVWGCALIHD